MATTQNPKKEFWNVKHLLHWELLCKNLTMNNHIYRIYYIFYYEYFSLLIYIQYLFKQINIYIL